MEGKEEINNSRLFIEGPLNDLVDEITKKMNEEIEKNLLDMDQNFKANKNEEFKQLFDTYRNEKTLSLKGETQRILVKMKSKILETPPTEQCVQILNQEKKELESKPEDLTENIKILNEKNRELNKLMSAINALDMTDQVESYLSTSFKEIDEMEKEIKLIEKEIIEKSGHEKLSKLDEICNCISELKLKEQGLKKNKIDSINLVDITNEMESKGTQGPLISHIYSMNEDHLSLYLRNIEMKKARPYL